MPSRPGLGAALAEHAQSGGERHLADFTQRDSIALPAVRVSFQAVVLQIAAEQAFGAGQHARLDPLTVSLSHRMQRRRCWAGAQRDHRPFRQSALPEPAIAAGGHPSRALLLRRDGGGTPSRCSMRRGAGGAPPSRGHSPRCVRRSTPRMPGSRRTRAKPPSSMFARAPRNEVSAVEELIRHQDHAFTTRPEGVQRFAEFQHRIGQIPDPSRWLAGSLLPRAHSGPGS